MKRITLLLCCALLLGGCHFQSDDRDMQVYNSAPMEKTYQPLAISESQLEYKDLPIQIAVEAVYNRNRTEKSEGVSIIKPLLIQAAGGPEKQRIFLYAYYGEFVTEGTSFVEKKVRTIPYELLFFRAGKEERSYFAEIIYPDQLPNLKATDTAFDPETKLKETIAEERDETTKQQALAFISEDGEILQAFHDEILQMEQADKNSKICEAVKEYLKTNQLNAIKSYTVGGQEHAV